MYVWVCMYVYAMSTEGGLESSLTDEDRAKLAKVFVNVCMGMYVCICYVHRGRS